MQKVLNENDSWGDSREGSRELFQQACEVIPGGVSANIKYFSPYPIMMEKGKGSKLIDVDGNEYIDYSLCYGALATGHGHPRITEAVSQKMNEIGTFILGTPHKLEVTLAQKLVQLYPGIDMVRFTNSGLESTLLAIRMAIAYTGKEKIGKFEGHYHGGFNRVLVSVNPDKKDAGRAKQPNAISESKGIPQQELNNTIVLPFNDLEATEAILQKHADELAAVILEPVQGGYIPAEQAFITGLRKITRKLNILLIFDEVKTGFRVSLGGAQRLYNVKPDLTALGKVLGGGYPIGAVGGSKEIMMISAPNQGSDIFSTGTDSTNTNEVVFHSGTYNGHPIVLAAGLETIHLLEEGSTIPDMFSKTNMLRTGLEKLYQAYGVHMQTIGKGSIFNIVLTDKPIKNYRDMWQADISLRQALDEELLKLGIYLKPLNRYSLSTVHSDEDIEKTIDAHETALKLVLQRKRVVS